MRISRAWWTVLTVATVIVAVCHTGTAIKEPTWFSIGFGLYWCVVAFFYMAIWRDRMRDE